MRETRIVVTGLGVVSSIGIGKDAFWNNALEGKSGISKVEKFDTANHFTHNGGEIKNFKAEHFMSKRKTKLMGRASQLAIAATKLALEDAGLNRRQINPVGVAVLIGTTSGEIPEMEAMDISWLRDGHDKVDRWSVVRFPQNNIPSNIAMEFKFKGKNIIFSTACAAGNYAIGYGSDLLRLGKADLIVAGGSDAFSYISFTGFNQLMAVAPEKCMPFDKNRKGMIPGEGSGILILERLEDARKRKAQIYAEILGYGLSCDAFHMTNPQVEGVSACMQKALDEAGLKPDEIDYISAHGTGTLNNDRTESAAINKVFHNRKVPVSSLKSMLGHTMGAASAIESIACCLTLKNDIIAPTINFETPDPDCDIDCVPNKPRKQKCSAAIKNAFAFGGNNSCLVFKKYG